MSMCAGAISSVVAICSVRWQDRSGSRLGSASPILGQFEYLERAVAKLKLVVPATLLIIFVLLYHDLRAVR
jgi:hypothetical protein